MENDVAKARQLVPRTNHVSNYTTSQVCKQTYTNPHPIAIRAATIAPLGECQPEDLTAPSPIPGYGIFVFDKATRKNEWINLPEIHVA